MNHGDHECSNEEDEHIGGEHEFECFEECDGFCSIGRTSGEDRPAKNSVDDGDDATGGE